jgi:hypothetical protein
LADVMIDYEEKLYLAIAALRGAGFLPLRLILDRPARLGPNSIDHPKAGPARALDLDIDFDAEQEPHIVAAKDERVYHAPIAARRLARWLASDAGQREPLAMIPTYDQPRLRVVG